MEEKLFADEKDKMEKLGVIQDHNHQIKDNEENQKKNQNVEEKN